jgi:hypothetical protein
MDPAKNLLSANIEVKLTADGNQWYVVACSASIENTEHYALPPGEFFPSKDTAIAEMKRRIMAWLKERGRKETEATVAWRVP